MKYRALVFVALSTVAVQVGAASPVTEKSVRELMTLTGSGDMGVQVIQNLMPAMKKMLPQVPESFWNEFVKEVNTDELINAIVPIYQKHYTEKDIRIAIDFYRSPAGRRLIEKQPVVLQESMQAGQQWGEQMARRAIEKLKKLENSPPTDSAPP